MCVYIYIYLSLYIYIYTHTIIYKCVYLFRARGCRGAPGRALAADPSLPTSRRSFLASGSPARNVGRDGSGHRDEAKSTHPETIRHPSACEASLPHIMCSNAGLYIKRFA